MVHVTPEGELHLYHQNTLAYRHLDHPATTLLVKPSTPTPRYTPRPPDAKARCRRNAYLLAIIDARSALRPFPLSGGLLSTLHLRKRGAANP